MMLLNLHTIRCLFPDCPIFVNTILTRPTCELILSGKFDVKDFSEKYGCYVNLLPYIQLVPDITAPRSLLVKTLQHVDEQIPGYLSDYLTRLDINQEKCVMQFNAQSGRYEECTCDFAECGHSVNFRKYSDSGTCYVCDMKRVFGV